MASSLLYTLNVEPDCGLCRHCAHEQVPYLLLHRSLLLSFFSAAFSGTSSMPAQNVHEMTIGSIVFQVAEGDITKEEGDVIVNITNKTFSLKKGTLVDLCMKTVCVVGRAG